MSTANTTPARSKKDSTTSTTNTNTTRQDNNTTSTNATSTAAGGDKTKTQQDVNVVHEEQLDHPASARAFYPNLQEQKDEPSNYQQRVETDEKGNTKLKVQKANTTLEGEQVPSGSNTEGSSSAT